MSFVEETFTVKRPSRAGDGAGGKTVAYQTIGTLVATRNFYRHISEERQEMGAHNSAGPGVATRTKIVLIVDLERFPRPDVLVNDHLINQTDGRVHSVLFARPYEATFQIDTEVFDEQS